MDGVFEDPGRWSFPFFSDDAGEFKDKELAASDAQLLGRLTYEGFAKAWPTMEGTGDFGVKMNTMPKYLVSTTVHHGDPVTEHVVGLPQEAKGLVLDVEEVLGLHEQLELRQHLVARRGGEHGVALNTRQ